MGEKEKQGAKTKLNVSKIEAPRENVVTRVKIFSEEVIHEFHKIVWPKRKVTVGLAGIVVLMVIILSFYLGSIDTILGRLVASLL